MIQKGDIVRCNQGGRFAGMYGDVAAIKANKNVEVTFRMEHGGRETGHEFGAGILTLCVAGGVPADVPIVDPSESDTPEPTPTASPGVAPSMPEMPPA